MVGWMTGFKQFVPCLHLRLVQADFAEHGNPTVYVYWFIHTSVLLIRWFFSSSWP